MSSLVASDWPEDLPIGFSQNFYQLGIVGALDGGTWEAGVAEAAQATCLELRGEPDSRSSAPRAIQRETLPGLPANDPLNGHLE
jgi:hypothetical protein